MFSGENHSCPTVRRGSSGFGVVFEQIMKLATWPSFGVVLGC